MKYSLKVESEYDEVKENVIIINRDTHIYEYIYESATHNFYKIKNGSKLTIHTVLEARSAKHKDSERVIDIYHEAELMDDGCSVYIDCRGVIDGKNKIIYRSNIKVKGNFKNLYGEENLKFINLSKDAEIDAIPAIEIKENNLNATHTLQIIRLDEKKLFYLLAHGLTLDEAREVFVEGMLK